MDFENLTPEQIEKAKACKTPAELIALAEEEGYELSAEELDSLAGASSGWGVSKPCPNDTTTLPEAPCIFV